MKKISKQFVIKNLNLGDISQVLDLAFWLWLFDPGFFVLSHGSWVSNPGFWVLGNGFYILNPGYNFSGRRSRVSVFSVIITKVLVLTEINMINLIPQMLMGFHGLNMTARLRGNKMKRRLRQNLWPNICTRRSMRLDIKQNVYFLEVLVLGHHRKGVTLIEARQAFVAKELSPSYVGFGQIA